MKDTNRTTADDVRDLCATDPVAAMLRDAWVEATRRVDALERRVLEAERRASQTAHRRIVIARNVEADGYVR